MEKEIKTLSFLNNPDFLISLFGLILAVLIIVTVFVISYEISMIGEDEK